MNNTDRLCLGCMNDNGGASVCPICGYDASAPVDPSAIKPGTWLKERFLLGRVLETTGEGITYIGWDNLNNNVVYIKEYLPTGLCAKENGEVKITSGKEYEFNNGIMQFIELSRTVNELELPSLMPVVDTAEMNGTAYSITRAAAGITLREFLLRNGGSLKWEQARPLFIPLITTLEGLHNAGIFHCGISPETIIVGRDGKLHLSGISILQVRTAASEFTSQIFPGFAAIEQYSAERKIGAHTDVYGFAATLFRVLIGNPPMAATERLQRDNMSIPAKAAETIPPYVLTALANALQIEPENRTADMSALRAALTPQTADVPTRTAKSAPEKKKIGTKQYALIAGLLTALVLLGVAATLAFTVFRDQLFPQEDVGSSSYVSAPSVSSFGEQDSSYDNTPVERLYDVPKFENEKYAAVVNDVDYSQTFKFKLKDTKHSDSVPEGYIISQSVKAGEKVKKETEIELIVSAGPAEITIPDLTGKSQIDAYITLLELGFAKESIEFMERYDDTKPPQSIISAEPEFGTKISRYDSILIFINSYEETDELDTYDGSSSSDVGNSSSN